MEEKDEVFGEQSEVQADSPMESSEQTVAEDEQSEAERGVPIGKFKSVDDLYRAYNSLQSEFTKKCQKLAEIEKEKVLLPTDEQLNEEFKAFLLENQEAYSYADEIKAKVFADDEIKMQKRPFDTVWAGMLYEKLRSSNKANEPMVQNLILKDEEIKNLVIENYMKDLAQNKTPFVMSSETGERVAEVVTQKPDSFEKAKQIAISLLK